MFICGARLEQFTIHGLSTVDVTVHVGSRLATLLLEQVSTEAQSTGEY
jgi:hypothetical protein